MSSFDWKSAAIVALCLACGLSEAENLGAVSAGADLDSDGGHRFDLGLNWSPSESTLFSAFGGRADLSTGSDNFANTVVLVGADRSFGTVGVAGHVQWWRSADLLSARSLAGSLYFKREPWRLDLRGEVRDSEFDSFDFDAVIPVRNADAGAQAQVAGRAVCSLDNSAYGALLSRSSGGWLLSTGGTVYDYSDARCDIRDLRLPPQLARLPALSREVFRRIAGRALNATAQFVSSQLTRGNGFLESTVTAGVQYQAGGRTWAVDYFHDREEFARFKSNTLIGSLTLPVGARADLELRLGGTDSDFEGTIGFAGATFYVYLGGGA